MVRVDVAPGPLVLSVSHSYGSYSTVPGTSPVIIVECDLPRPKATDNVGIVVAVVVIATNASSIFILCCGSSLLRDTRADCAVCGRHETGASLLCS